MPMLQHMVIMILICGVMPGIEYNIFPYSESTRRQLRILYKVGYGYANYIDTTEYFLFKETPVATGSLHFI